MVYIEKIQAVERKYRDLEKKIRNELNECENRLNILNKELENKIKEMDKITVLEKVGELKEEEKEELNKKIAYLQNEICRIHEKKQKLKEKIDGIEPIKVVGARERRKLAKKLFMQAKKVLDGLERERIEETEKLKILEKRTIPLENNKKVLEGFKSGKTRLTITQYPNKRVWLEKEQIEEKVRILLGCNRWKEYKTIQNLKPRLSELDHHIPLLKEMVEDLAVEAEKLKEISDIYKEPVEGLEQKEKDLKRLKTKLENMTKEKKEIETKIEENKKKLHNRIMKKIDETIPEIEKELSDAVKEKKRLEDFLDSLKDQIREVDREKRRLHAII